MKYILVLQGSFNPITKAHVELIEIVYEYFNSIGYKIEEKLIMPTSDKYPWKTLESNIHRTNMINIATNDKNIKISNIEIDKYEWIRSQEAMKILKSKYTEETLIYICGGDKVVELEKWKNYYESITELNKYCTIVCVPRFGYDHIEALKKLKLEKLVNILPINYDNNTSSTYAKNNINNNNKLKEYLDENVIKYVQKNKLYINDY